MSISYELYNTSAENPAMNEWDSDQSLPIARPKEVQDRIMKLYPRIHDWSTYESGNASQLYDYPIFYSALGVDNCSFDKEYLDIALQQNGDGYIHFISVRKGSPKLVGELLEEFDLKYVFEFQSCRLIDPYQYVGNWEPKNGKP